MKVREIPLSTMTLLPPRPDVCQECAVQHDADLPHNTQSLYYQYSFFMRFNRWPTWADAMAHCSEEMRATWTKALAEYGIKVNE
jgi:hypothetical protein